MTHLQIHRRWLCAVTAALWMSLLPAVAVAASLQVAPTMLELRPGQDAEALWISNSGTEPVQVQIRLFRWGQSSGSDELLPTEDLLISPPMQQLAAGQRQLVRIMRPGDTAAPPEQQSYRIIVDEIPTFDPDRSGMQFVLRYSIPVFLQPDGGPPQPRLQARLIDTGDGASRIEVVNQGDGYAQLADLTHGATGQPLVVRAGLLGYVLPGQTMQWPLEQPPHRFAEGGFTARINGESAPTPLPTTPAPR